VIGLSNTNTAMTAREKVTTLAAWAVLNVPAAVGTYFGLVNDGLGWTILAIASIATFVVQVYAIAGSILQNVGKSLQARVNAALEEERKANGGAFGEAVRQTFGERRG